jgi:hypothetical protein
MVATHLWCDYGGVDDVRAFECSLRVPPGGDPLCSYYMACGFHRGYLGMQVLVFLLFNHIFPCNLR